MRFFAHFLVSVAGVSAAGLSPRDCSRNNCNRAVGGTRIPGHLNTASADCSRILASTVYEATVTVYSNVTRTIGKRQITGAPVVRKFWSHCRLTGCLELIVHVAKYATAGCDDLAEYSSACSCLGVTGHGITVGITVSIIYALAHWGYSNFW